MVRKTLQLTFLMLELWLTGCMVNAQFTVQPVSVVQAEGLEAVFECLNPESTSHSWGINGDFPTDGNFPTDLIRQPPSGGAPGSLTIPAIPEYNNTVVQCRAIVVVGGGPVFVLSDNATLTVYAQSNFTVQPVSIVQAEGLEAVFECQYPGATYDWFINGTIHREDTEDIVARLPSGDSPASLSITARPEYNNVSVQCRILLELGQDMFRLERSNIATLVVYGLGITSVINGEDTIRISWDHPFTTSITYCVDVIQTFGSTETSHLISSECGLTDTTYSFPSPGHGPCDRFNFTVTPTDGVDNGTSSQPVTGYFTQARGVANVRILPHQKIGLKEVTIEPLVPNGFVPTSFQAHSSVGAVHSIRVDYSTSSLTISLPSDIKTILTLTLADSSGLDVLFEIPISTFDIQDIAANSCSQTNCVDVSLTFNEASPSPGALIAVVPMSENGLLEPTKASYRIVGRNVTEHALTANTGSNRVLTFDLENDDELLVTPITTAAATQIVDGVSGIEVSPNYPTEDENIQATRTNNGDVTVTSKNDSFVYLVLIHSGSNPNQLYVGYLNGSNDTAVLDPDDSSDVNLVILSWKTGESYLNARVSLVYRLESPTIATPMLSTEPACYDQIQLLGIITGVVLAVVVIVVVIIVIILCLIVITRKNSQGFDLTHDQTQKELQTQPNEAYELVTKKNVSYEKVGRRRQRNQPATTTQPQAGQLEVVTETPHQYEEVLPPQQSLPSDVQVV